MDSLVNAQINYLVATKSSVTKTAAIDSAQDKSNFMPDSTQWANEMEIFRHLDLINKPIYIDAYDLLEVEDNNSNLRVKILNANKDVPIKQFKIYYHNTIDKVRKIEATLNEQNTLYYTSRNFLIELEDFKDKMILSSYRVQGVQKMILRDSVKFSIRSKIDY
jgi:hypothetical protein